MFLETRYKASFSRRKVIDALKAHYPNCLVVQAIPDKGDDMLSTPTLSATGDAIHITWTRVTKTP